MIVAVVGAGAREHALAEALSRTADVLVTPGNPGIPGRSKEGFLRSVTNAPVEELEADLVVIGPEAPLVSGLADRLRKSGRAVLGPSARAARLEGSKAFMKEVATAAGVPTARYGVFDEASPAFRFLDELGGPYVIKTDGLAGGKGVLVTTSRDEARRDVEDKLNGRSFGEAGRRVVVEECLVGEEVSLLVLCDGRTAVPLPVARDYKRLADGDRGPNTGGMGAFSPVLDVTEEMVGSIMELLVRPTLCELEERDCSFNGVLYAGVILTKDGPKLVEYNIRFGDPEAEVVLPRLGGDLAAALYAAATGSLEMPPPVVFDAAVCVVLAAAGYPHSPRSGDYLRGLSEAGTVEGVSVFHAGTTRDAGELRTAGGRVLTISAVAPNLREARRRAYAAVEAVSFPGMQFRSDIAAAAVLAESSVGR